MTAVEIWGGVASVASFIFLGLALIGQFNCTIKSKSYRTHVRVAGAIAGLLLLISLIWVDWGIGYGVFYAFAEVAQIISIICSKKAKARAEKAEAELFEAGKTAGIAEAEALSSTQLAAAKAEGIAEAKAEAQEAISALKVTLAEKDAIISIYNAQLNKK